MKCSVARAFHGNGGIGDVARFQLSLGGHRGPDETIILGIIMIMINELLITNLHENSWMPMASWEMGEMNAMR